MIKIDAVKFKVATICASVEETRYYLNGVYVEPHPERGALLTATDGHRLISIYDSEAECSKAAIIGMNKPLLSACVPPKTLGMETHWLSVDNSGIVSVGHYRSPKPDTIDGSFPDWRKIVPTKPEPKEGEEPPAWQFSPANFNWRYIADFGKAASVLHGGGEKARAGIRILARGSDPALVLFDGVPYAFGILMPMRGTEASDAPAYMSAALKPAAPTASPLPTEPAPAPEVSAPVAKVVSIKRASAKKKSTRARKPVRKQTKSRRRAA